MRGVTEGLMRTPCGAWVVINDTHVGKWIAETGRLDHDRWLLDLIEPRIPVGGVVVDVGALYGDHTIAYSRRVGVDGLVFAFEPHITAFRCLYKNMKHFGCHNVLCVPSALGEKDAEASLMVDHANIGATMLIDGMGGNQVVQVETLDEQEPEFERLDFIKIDAEGMECAIIRGGMGVIQKFKPVMLVEVNRSRLRDHGESAEKLIKMLRFLGYRCAPLQPDLGEDAEQFDLLALP